jgi:Winged helix-turn-helix DNA-binding
MPSVEVLTEVSKRNPEAAPARSVRRATARRASNRRATDRRRHGDVKASIIEFLAQHAGSTAGELAKGLNLNRGKVSTRLTQLAKTGKIKKTSHGYSTQHQRDPVGTSAHFVGHTEPAGLDRGPEPHVADCSFAPDTGSQSDCHGYRRSA